MEDTNIPSSGFTDKQLKFSYWYVSNKLLLRKGLILSLIIINLLLWGYSFYGFMSWAIDYDRLRQQTLELMFSPSPALGKLEATKPQQLSISSVSSFNGGDSYNFIAEVFNPNLGWQAEFEYAFVSDDSYSYFKSYALPGQKKLLLESGRMTSNVNLEIRNINWKKIENFEELKNIRDRIDIVEQEFIPPTIEDGPSRLRFTIRNDSAYTYWEINLIAFLYSGGSQASIGYLTTYQLKSGEERTLEINWVKALPNIDGVEIVTETNFLDPKNIIAPTAQ
jgi:hypothetical protein